MEVYLHFKALKEKFGHKKFALLKPYHITLVFLVIIYLSRGLLRAYLFEMGLRHSVKNVISGI